jgi:hypothetical protein
MSRIFIFHANFVFLGIFYEPSVRMWKSVSSFPSPRFGKYLWGCKMNIFIYFLIHEQSRLRGSFWWRSSFFVRPRSDIWIRSLESLDSRFVIRRSSSLTVCDSKRKYPHTHTHTPKKPKLDVSICVLTGRRRRVRGRGGRLGAHRGRGDRAGESCAWIHRRSGGAAPGSCA